MNPLLVKSEEFAKGRKEAIKAVEQEHGPVVASMTDSILDSLLISALVLELIENPLFRFMSIDLLSRLSTSIVHLNIKAYGVSRETGTLALDIAKRLHSVVLNPLLSTLAGEQAEQDEQSGALLGRALFDLMNTLSNAEMAAAAAAKQANDPLEELLNVLKRGPRGAVN